MKDNDKMREYHTDTHPIFESMSPKMSVRCHPSAN